MDGTCHCGAVRVRVPAAPGTVTECRCSICRRIGALWAYYPAAAVIIEGPTVAYAWGRRRLAFHRCGVCGCVMGWRAFHAGYPECGVNARILEGLDLGAVARVVEDDASA